MMLHVYTEEPSAKNVFEQLLPKILPEGYPYRIYQHQGKQDLERALTKTLPTISKIPGSKILITRDQDNADCLVIKNRLLDIIEGNCHCDFKVRIICRELEAWFLGDLEAICLAFPRFKPEQYAGRADFRNVDKLASPSELLLKIIPEYSDRDYLPKIEVSELISKNMDLDRNKSVSFFQTCASIRNLVNH